MMYVLISEFGNVYPYSYYDLQRDNPQVSFPAEPNTELLGQWSVVEVSQTPRPEHDDTTQVAIESGVNFNSELSRWEVSWVVRDMTPEELIDKANDHLFV
jgi:hypothetical protein